jgi:hypothetical protein
MRTDQPVWTVIETADGSGDAVHRTLGFEYISICPEKIQEERFYKIVAMIDRGNVYLPNDAHG